MKDASIFSAYIFLSINVSYLKIVSCFWNGLKKKQINSNKYRQVDREQHCIYSVSVNPPRDLMNKCGHRYKFIKNGLKALAVLKGAAPRAGGSFDGPTRANIPDLHPNNITLYKRP